MSARNPALAAALDMLSLPEETALFGALPDGDAWIIRRDLVTLATMDNLISWGLATSYGKLTLAGEILRAELGAE